MRVNMTRSQHGETEMMLLAGRKEVDAPDAGRGSGQLGYGQQHG
jgi:hypothetical protein